MRQVELPHKVCGMSCTINGLEDLYEWKTGNRLPDWLLFYLSDMAGFAYIKNKLAPVPHMVFWGAAAKKQYQTLADIVGFEWHVLENRSFAYTFKQAREYIDQDLPVIIGALDMYHLPYYQKFYHNFHIPIHYVLLVGYDDEREVVLVHDCDREDVQEVPYVDLQLAWNVNVPGLSKKNTLFAFEFDGQTADITTIVHSGLGKKVESMLNPPAGMLGIKGMRKLARELPAWPKKLTTAQVDASLRHLVEYTGVPPLLPNRLTGYHDSPDDHTAGRVGFANLLHRLAADYNRPAWAEAANLFTQSGQLLQKMTDVVVDFLLEQQSSLEPAAELVTRAADVEEQAYTVLATNEGEA
jgi:hypothetical protein